MTIQLLDLGAEPTPTTLGGEGGDTYREAHAKINANFNYLESKTVPVANTLGTSTTTAASQALITNQIGDIGAVLDAVNGVVA
ncbi:hypothetical protein ACI2I3_10190 [Psychrobacter namhaensis]|uniref:Uncharacterized protein n=1 Tax=Psychrobacter namhaensis TaxID=292734 RepID=A0ABW8LCQ2_9GAMM